MFVCLLLLVAVVVVCAASGVLICGLLFGTCGCSSLGVYLLFDAWGFAFVGYGCW